MPVYLTLSQVAERVHVPLETVRYWIYAGKLPAYKPGRSPLVREDELAAFVEGAAVDKQRAAKAKRTRTAVRKGSAA